MIQVQHDAEIGSIEGLMLVCGPGENLIPAIETFDLSSTVGPPVAFCIAPTDTATRSRPVGAVSGEAAVEATARRYDISQVHFVEPQRPFAHTQLTHEIAKPLISFYTGAIDRRR